jgi:phosphatidylserine/phosphatidylglycerophosphate/cardiolipin synthase-like enzyme
MANSDFQVSGNNNMALFTLKLHRGEGMTLIAMNWKEGVPPIDFVGFAIEYKEPNSNKYFVVKNRIEFAKANKPDDPNRFSSRRSPIQKFRWVHFPRNPDLKGLFTYRVTPVFMNNFDELSYGEFQEVGIELRRETYPGVLNIGFTRGFVSSQAFVDRFEKFGAVSTLLPGSAKKGLIFKPSHPKAVEALHWMGFEGRRNILDLLDDAIADPQAQVRVVAYDLSLSEFVERLEKLGNRLRIIIDNSADHKETGSGENQSETRLIASTGAANVKRQHMGSLQHNKMIVVDSPTIKAVVYGSTNFSWRGFFVQANNTLVVRGDRPVQISMAAFDNYWNHETPETFGDTDSATWHDLQLPNIEAKVAFSPHIATNALLKEIADDVSNNVSSSLFYSLAFLFQTQGVILDAINKVTNDSNIFVYGMSDKEVGGIVIQKPDGNLAPVAPQALTEKSLPKPFKAEPTGGGGIRLHHKFLVLDFDKPTARVYLGSYNFSIPADISNGENLVMIKDRRVAVAYMIEALRLFDHYHFRAIQLDASLGLISLSLKKPPKIGEIAWWKDDFTDGTIKQRDRLLFS